MGIAREPFDPCMWIVASNAAIATHMSEGLVAMQCSLVPRIASVLLLPVIAGQPVPGSRLLQGIAMSRKYAQRVRWSKLPAVVAMLRSCAEAPLRMACDSTA
jgi:hypothetical protein